MTSMLNVPTNCISLQPQKLAFLPGTATNRLGAAAATANRINLMQRFSSSPAIKATPNMSISAVLDQRRLDTPVSNNNMIDMPIMMNGCSGKRNDRSSFAQTAAVRHLVGSVLSARGLRFAVVVARFNEIITKPLLEGALTTFKNYSVQEEDIDVVWVPGSFEIGVVAQKLGSSGRFHAVLCIGAVIRGDTTHYDAVANSAASGVLSAGLKSGIPCIFGVLTCDNMEQALNRAGGKSGNKGSETALTAIEMASLFVHQMK